MEVTAALMLATPIPLFEYSHLEAQGIPLSTRAKEELKKQGITELRWVHLLTVMNGNGQKIPFADLDKIPFEAFPVKGTLDGVPVSVKPEMLVGDLKEEVSMLVASLPDPSFIQLFIAEEVGRQCPAWKRLVDNVQMKDCNIKDGSKILVARFSQRTTSAPTDGSGKETAKAQTLSLPLTDSYDAAIDMVTSMGGLPREYVVERFRKFFGDVNGTAEYICPAEVREAQLPREDGWRDIQMLVTKVCRNPPKVRKSGIMMKPSLPTSGKHIFEEFPNVVGRVEEEEFPDVVEKS